MSGCASVWGSEARRPGVRTVCVYACVSGRLRERAGDSNRVSELLLVCFLCSQVCVCVCVCVCVRVAALGPVELTVNHFPFIAKFSSLCSVGCAVSHQGVSVSS